LIIDFAIVATLDIQKEVSGRRAEKVIIMLRELKNREKEIIQEVDLTCSRNSREHVHLSRGSRAALKDRQGDIESQKIAPSRLSIRESLQLRE
jgi:hypothetical protein